jgi:hypothetical protein
MTAWEALFPPSPPPRGRPRRRAGPARGRDGNRACQQRAHDHRAETEVRPSPQCREIDEDRLGRSDEAPRKSPPSEHRRLAELLESRARRAGAAEGRFVLPPSRHDQERRHRHVALHLRGHRGAALAGKAGRRPVSPSLPSGSCRVMSMSPPSDRVTAREAPPRPAATRGSALVAAV